MSARPRRRVLIIEDERLLADVMRDLLSEHHDVEVASTVVRAVRLLREDVGFDVILCDALLPDGTAADIYRAYCAVWPERGRRFIFVTGGTDDEAVKRLLATGTHRVLKKPFDLDSLPSLIDDHASVV
jgi:two-component system, NtrC family, sensor kinase